MHIAYVRLLIVIYLTNTHHEYDIGIPKNI